MIEVFHTIFKMSITASYVILAVLLIRLFFRKLPKIFSYALWLPVFIRLVFPSSFHSDFSFLNLINLKESASPITSSYISRTISQLEPSQAISALNTPQYFSTSLPDTSLMSESLFLQTLIKFASLIWAAGIVLLLLYSMLSYRRVLKTIKTATRIKSNIFETDRISTPFVCGFFKPKIYLPIGLAKEERSYVVLHEQTHIKRLDYLIKPMAFLLLILHWFNPLVWLAFVLMSKDMEMSCDEGVIKKMGITIKSRYSHLLVSLSVQKNQLQLGSPLAFGENYITSRVKNVINYKKPSFWIASALIVLIIMLIICFTANPKNEQVDLADTYFGYNVNALISNKTLYIGNHSKVVSLVDSIALPKDITRDTIELQTKAPPYGLTIHLSMKDASDITYQNALSTNTLFRNAAILFSLIDNASNITYQVSDHNGEYTGASYAFTFTRKMVEERLGEDVRSYSTHTDALKTLIDKLHLISFDIKADNSIQNISYNEQIENSLEVIVSLAHTSSNPYDYIKAHSTSYESILKMGEPALNYLLAQFENGNVSNDVRGHIIMALCKDLLGSRNNVRDESLLPLEWFSMLSPHTEIRLPHFSAKSSDPIEQLVYDAVINKYGNRSGGFMVVAPTLYGSYEEDDKLKIFATVYINYYNLYGKELVESGGGIIPAAITFSRNIDGSYQLDEYLEAMDGSYFVTSIKDFSVMPVSKKIIKGLSDQILEDYGNQNPRSELLMHNLIEHLKTNSQHNIMLRKITGEEIPLT